jgi:hypothetical protein
MADSGPEDSYEPARDVFETSIAPPTEMAAFQDEPGTAPDKPEPPEKDADADAKTQSVPSPMSPFDGDRSRTGAAREARGASGPSTKPVEAKASDPMETPVSPPAPNADARASVRFREQGPGPSQASSSGNNASTRATVAASPPSPKAPPQPEEVLRGPQSAAALTTPAMLASALTGGLRRADTAIKSGVSAATADSGSTRSLTDRLAVKSILDNLRRSESRPSPAQASPAFSANATAAHLATPDAPTPSAGALHVGLRDKLSLFTTNRMQSRRDAEHSKSVSQAGVAAVASLEALESRETGAILTKIRDAAKAIGGIEYVLSEMRPGGAFEDLRKEFNVALSHNEGFAAAYEKATSAVSGYAGARAGMITATRSGADANLARLEVLDQEIGAAAKALPGVKDGKSVLDEALEGGKEIVEKTFTAVRQAFSRDSTVRGPSPSPSFGR